ncbi:hypothetical protein [Quadrisphaera sp. INWT6]|uniref:hypothetical protein n=1 Tax=Quadrisphaera sp. INWT6 TaxID=2596917 RepID=UPI0018924E04|nr:hypothetical protein [Quadrisphaera sp. INWT6]MBF5083621.1 hypothetical protein [Quadrisphaera sp. INWT6]
MTLLTPTETGVPAQRAPRGGLRAALRASSSATSSAPQRPAPLSEPALDAVLDELTAEGWTVLGGLTWPGRWSAGPAHLMVGPGGVVVVDVDARPWRLTPDGGLRLGRRDGVREGRAVARRAADVASLLRHEHRDAVRAVLCLTSQPLPAVLLETGTTVAGTRGLAVALRELPVVLDAVDVRETSAHLQRQLASREQRLDRRAALLGLVPAPRPATDAAPVFLAATTATTAPAAEAEAAPSVFTTRREALAAERGRSRRSR